MSFVMIKGTAYNTEGLISVSKLTLSTESNYTFTCEFEGWSKRPIYEKRYDAFDDLEKIREFIGVDKYSKWDVQ